MRVYVSDLLDGDKLQKDVFSAIGLHILSAGTLLTSTEIAKLMLHNISFVEIDYRENSVKPSNTSAAIEVPESIRTLYSAAANSLQTLFGQASIDNVINLEDVQNFYDPLVDSFKNQTDIVRLLLTLHSKDDYTYQHSVQVGIITYFIAKWMGKAESDARFAGKAGYLHDIGKSKIPDAVLKKPEKLTAQEYEEMKNHTQYGYDILNRSFGSSVISLVALQHHERLNGSGYPNGLKAAEIHPVSRIVAVADIYSAMISARVYQKERNMLAVLQELHRMSFSELDPVITHAFIKHMIPNLIGKKVKLNTGERGVIILTNPSDFFRPLIRVNGAGFIDLSSPTSKDKSIAQLYM